MSFAAITTDMAHFYLVTSTGELLWYADVQRDGSNASDGSTGWAPRSGAQLGIGWDRFSQVFSGGDGIIYAIQPTGELLWHRDLSRDGTARWAGRSGAQIGVGWNMFSQVFSGGDGVIYGITRDGRLLWYRDLRRDGSNAANGSSGWDPRSGSQIGVGWTAFSQVISGGNGVIYAVRPTGELLWYRDLRRDGRNASDGSSGWDRRSGSRIGDGWDIFTAVLPGGGGVLYGVTVDGFLLFYRDLAGDGTPRWANAGLGSTIRSGWFLAQPLTPAVQGYAVPQSVVPGDVVEFKVSAAAPYVVSYLRLKPQDDGALGMSVAPPFHRAEGAQDVPREPWRNGCDWRTSFSVRVDQGWRPGIYAAHCVASDDTETYIDFVVRPDPAHLADFAVLANTNTWNAYNDWGGRSKYSSPPAAVLSFDRPNPATGPMDDGQRNHLTRAELWVLSWLEDAGFRADVYSDNDFHVGIDGLEAYKALILSTHPEYWTPEMMDNLESYLASGGSLLYLGGNGLFERVQYSADGRALILLGGNPASLREGSYYRNLAPARPERAVLGVAYRYDGYQTYAPFQVRMAGHRFFAGTGVRTGDLIGADGRNGAASGWEMDTSLPGRAAPGRMVTARGADDRGEAPANLQLLARGTNPGDPPFGADMTYYETGAGGFVFAVGSISFGGSLVQDPQLQIVVGNVLNECLERAQGDA